MVKHKQPGFKYVQIMVGFCAIWCCLFLIISCWECSQPFSVWHFRSLQLSYCQVRPWTVLSVYVSLQKDYIIRKQPSQPAEKISPSFTQLYLSFIPGCRQVSWGLSSCQGATSHVRIPTVWVHVITQYITISHCLGLGNVKCRQQLARWMPLSTRPFQCMCRWWMWRVVQLRATTSGWRNSCLILIRPIPLKLKSFAWTKWLVIFLLVMDGGVGSHEKRSCTSSNYGRLVGQTGDQQCSSVDQPLIASALGTRGLGASTATCNGVSWRNVAKRYPPNVMCNKEHSHMLEEVWPRLARFLSTYWALFSGYLGPLWVSEGMLDPFEAIISSSCWAYVEPILTHFWPLVAQIKNFDPMILTCTTEHGMMLSLF